MSAHPDVDAFAAKAILVGVIAFGVSAGAVVAQVLDRDTRWIAPPRASAKANPLATRPGLAAGGGKLFRERCTPCHGDGARGTTKGPDLLAADVQAQRDGALFWKITTGNSHAGMPPFSFLPEGQRWQLVLHLRDRASALH